MKPITVKCLKNRETVYDHTYDFIKGKIYRGDINVHGFIFLTTEHGMQHSFNSMYFDDLFKTLTPFKYGK